MSAIKCQQCVGPLADCCCTCGPKSTYICTKCIEQHVNRTGPHLFFGLKQALVSPDVSERCEVCAQMSAMEVCTCTFPLVALCMGCKICHVALGVRKQHLFLPLAAKGKIRSLEDLTIMKRDYMRISVAEDILRQNLARISSCEAAEKQRSDELIAAAGAYCHQQTQPLSYLKKALRSAIDLGMARVKEKLADLSEAPKDEVAGLLGSYLLDRKQEALSLFRIRETEPELDVQPLFGLDWESRLDESDSIQPSFSRLSPRPPRSHPHNPANPLDFPTLEDYLAAANLAESTDPMGSQYRLRYYQSHVQCAQAREEAFAETLRAMDGEDSLEAWVKCGEGLLTRKVGGKVPTRCQEELVRSLKNCYESDKEKKRLERRNTELKSILAGLEKKVDKRTETKKEVTVEIARKKQGRPRKNGSTCKRHSAPRPSRKKQKTQPTRPAHGSSSHSDPRTSPDKDLAALLDSDDVYPNVSLTPGDSAKGGHR